MPATFKELMEIEKKTEAERILIQAIATLSTMPAYRSRSLEDIYQQQRQGALRVEF